MHEGSYSLIFSHSSIHSAYLHVNIIITLKTVRWSSKNTHCAPRYKFIGNAQLTAQTTAICAKPHIMGCTSAISVQLFSVTLAPSQPLLPRHECDSNVFWNLNSANLNAYASHKRCEDKLQLDTYWNSSFVVWSSNKLSWNQIHDSLNFQSLKHTVIRQQISSCTQEI